MSRNYQDEESKGFVMRYLFVVLLPVWLAAFEPRPITPYPVVGYRELSMPDSRPISIWYPVKPAVQGEPSGNPWDLFNVAKGADFPLYSPLIVVSHGLTGNPHQLSWLILYLTKAGYAVAAVQHKDLLEDGKPHINHWRRAEDVKEIVDALLKEGKIDPKRIGMAGFSLGGTTAVWVIGGRSTKLDAIKPTKDFAAPQDFAMMEELLPTLDRNNLQKDWKDPRIKAAFIMAPAWAWIFDEQSLNKVSIPTYFIASEEDTVLVTKNNAGFFAKMIPYSIYKTIPGKVDHFIFITALGLDGQKKVNLPFLFNDDPSISRLWIQYQIGEEASRFFDSALNR